MRAFMVLYFIWISSTFWGFLLGLSAPAEGGPLDTSTCLAGIVFSFCLLVVFAEWMERRA